MPRPIHVALIGQKFMGRAHSNAWNQVGHFFDGPRPVHLHTVAARDQSELIPFAKRWGWDSCSDDWRSLASIDEVELVDVGTPNHLHAEQALTMLAAGKHVACEKPLAGTLADARQMRDAARKAKGSKTFVWFNYRRCPAVALAHQLVRAGKIGSVLHVRAQYLQDWGGPSTPMSWRFKKSLAGSGAHGDLNAHIVDMARFITGDEIHEVHGAVARTFIKERAQEGKRGKARSDVDDCVLFVASFKGGATASFEATRLACGNQNRNTIEINGTKGSVRFDFEDMNVLHFIGPSDDPRIDGWQRIMCTSAGNHPYADAWWPDAHVIGYEHCFTNMAADIVKVLSRRKPLVPLPDFEDAYQTQRVLEAALVSARERTAIRLSEVK
ncbi:MAG: Gfo/Idh/MocA family oxidoreductase [bacterium]